MRHVDDVIDIAVATLLSAVMLVMGVWCYYEIHGIYTQPVIEKTAQNLEVSGQWVDPYYDYTSDDVLLTMVVNDELCPMDADMIYIYTPKAGKTWKCTTSFVDTHGTLQTVNDYSQGYYASDANKLASLATLCDKQLELTFDNLWFSDKEASINSVWTTVYRDKLSNYEHSDWVPVFSSTQTGVVLYWACILYNS